MKARLGFVSNSSSSSYYVKNPDHPGYQFLRDMQDSGDYIIHEDQQRVEDLYDNGVWEMLYKGGFEWEDFLEQESFNG